MRFALNAVLARQVGPTTFGVYALAFTYSELLGICGAFSFPQALVQLDHGRRRLFGTVLWMSIAVTLALLVPAAVAAPFIGTRNGQAVAGTFLALVALRMLMALSSCVEGEMQRAYSYGRLAVIRVSGIALSAGAAWLAAANDWHLGALFLRDFVPLATVLVVGGILAVRAGGWRIFQIDKGTASEVWSLGRSLITVRGLEMAFAYTDQLIVGVALGTHELGLYAQARYLAQLPNAALAPVTNAVGLRVMSGIRSDQARLGRARSVLQYGLARVTTAAWVACFVAPDLLLLGSFGPDWLGAAEMLRALSPFVLLLPFFELEKALLVATRSWRGVRRAYVAMVVTLAVGTWTFARLYGGAGAAVAATAALLVGAALVRVSARREAPVEAGNLWPPLMSAGVGIAAGMGWRHASGALPPFAQGAAAVAISEAVYACALVILERKRLIAESRYVIGHLMGQRATPLGRASKTASSTTNVAP